MKIQVLLVLAFSVSAMAGDIRVGNTPEITFSKEFRGAAKDPQIRKLGLDTCEAALDSQMLVVQRAGAAVLLREPCRVDDYAPGTAGFEHVSGTIHFIR